MEVLVLTTALVGRRTKAPGACPAPKVNAKVPASDVTAAGSNTGPRAPENLPVRGAGAKGPIVPNFPDPNANASNDGFTASPGGRLTLPSKLAESKAGGPIGRNGVSIFSKKIATLFPIPPAGAKFTSKL